MRQFWHRSDRYLVIYLLIVGVMGIPLPRMPTAFLPDEDQGILFTLVQLPAGATQERTLKVIEAGGAPLSGGSKRGGGGGFHRGGIQLCRYAVRTTAWPLSSSRTGTERKRPDLKVKAVAGKAMAAFSKYP